MSAGEILSKVVDWRNEKGGVSVIPKSLESAGSSVYFQVDGWLAGKFLSSRREHLERQAAHMTPSIAQTFDELVGWTAANDPHGTVLGWWRRVDRALHEYAAARSLPNPSHRRLDFERVASCDSNLGPNCILWSLE